MITESFASVEKFRIFNDTLIFKILIKVTQFIEHIMNELIR